MEKKNKWKIIRGCLLVFLISANAFFCVSCTLIFGRFG